MGVWGWRGGTGLGRLQECGRDRLAQTCPAWRQSPLPAPWPLCLFDGGVWGRAKVHHLGTG